MVVLSKRLPGGNRGSQLIGSNLHSLPNEGSTLVARISASDSSDTVASALLRISHIVAMIYFSQSVSISALAWLGSAHTRRGRCAEPPRPVEKLLAQWKAPATADTATANAI